MIRRYSRPRTYSGISDFIAARFPDKRSPASNGQYGAIGGFATKCRRSHGSAPALRMLWSNLNLSWAGSIPYTAIAYAECQGLAGYLQIEQVLPPQQPPDIAESSSARTR